MQQKLFISIEDLTNTKLPPNSSLHYSFLADNHAHVNMCQKPFEVIKNFIKNNGKQIIDTSTNAKELTISKTLKDKYPNIIKIANAIHPEYLHPNALTFFKDKIEPKLQEALTFTKQKETSKFIIDYAIKLFEQNKNNINAIGEIGLDIYKLPQEFIKPTINLQTELLNAYLELASKYNKPIVLHIRGNTNQDHTLYLQALKIIKNYHSQHSLPAVYFHSFTATWQQAKPIIDAGYYIGINGIATYSSAKHLIEVIKNAPASQLLPETDSPFLIPNKAKTKFFINKNQNEPLGVKWVIEKILSIKNQQF